MRAGRIPKRFLPLQSGIGATANAVFKALGEAPEIPPFEMYSEILQDAVISGSSGAMHVRLRNRAHRHPGDHGYDHRRMPFFRRHLILRPQEISNNPEIIRRLGIISSTPHSR